MTTESKHTPTMKIFLTEKQVLELAMNHLDYYPNPDKIHDIAEKMDMVYDEHLDMFEDCEEHSFRQTAAERDRLKEENEKLRNKFQELTESKINDAVIDSIVKKTGIVSAIAANEINKNENLQSLNKELVEALNSISHHLANKHEFDMEYKNASADHWLIKLDLLVKCSIQKSKRTLKTG